MIPTLLKAGMILYGIIQVIVAFIALLLAVKWNKFEFLAGLICLFLYAIVEVINTFIFMNVQREFIGIAQFGFILLAIIFFIIGMHPSWAPRMVSGMGVKTTEKKPARPESVISLLRKQP
jgi:CDP-diglyceride synthetase